MEGAGLGDITLTPVSVGQGRREKEEEEDVDRKSRTTEGGIPTHSRPGKFSTTHCFVIVPVALCPR